MFEWFYSENCTLLRLSTPLCYTILWTCLLFFFFPNFYPLCSVTNRTKTNKRRMCAFVGLNYSNWIVMHGMETVKYLKYLCIVVGDQYKKQNSSICKSSRMLECYSASSGPTVQSTDHLVYQRFVVPFLKIWFHRNTTLIRSWVLYVVGSLVVYGLRRQ